MKMIQAGPRAIPVREHSRQTQEVMNRVYNGEIAATDPTSRDALALSWLGALVSQLVLVAAAMHGQERDVPTQRDAMLAIHRTLKSRFPKLPDQPTVRDAKTGQPIH